MKKVVSPGGGFNFFDKHAQPADISSSKFDYNTDEKQTNKTENHLSKRKIAYSVVKNA